MTNLRTYTELSKIDDFMDRYAYLKMQAKIGIATFGFDRYLNQRFYTSVQWRQVRQAVLARDGGCDLGVWGHDIHSRAVIHHMNPIMESQIVHGDDSILDPEFLITVSHWTHNAIHFGDERMLEARRLVVRTAGDTTLW